MRVPALCAVILAFLALPLEAATADALVRGPYLQLATPTSIVVRWRSDAPSDSRVRYGPAPGSLSLMVDVAGSTTDHVVALTGLTPETTYFYSVGNTSTALAGGDANHTFTTSPAAGSARATRVWVIGDSGTGAAGAQNVAAAYMNYSAARRTDLWLMLGDNAYNSGTDVEYQSGLFDIYPALLRNTVLWPTLGNHDAIAADSATQSGPYYDIFSLPAAAQAGGVPSGTEAYYSFDYGNIHFVCLDSQESDRSPAGAMLTWLASDLAATDSDWVIAFWHHPPYSKGSHDSDAEAELIEMRNNALPILESYGVDLVLTGHSHSYERSVLLDGHYGLSPSLTAGMIRNGGNGQPASDGAYHKPSLGNAANEGAVYVVAGSSGQVSAAPLNHPAMVVSLLSLGSLVLDIHDGTLNASFLDDLGAVVDSFTMRKGVLHDSVVLPLKPLTLHLSANSPGISRKVGIKVRNADLGATVEPAGHTIRLNVDPGDCPAAMIVGEPDFDVRTNGDQSAVVVPPGKAKKAQLRLNVSPGLFPTYNKLVPYRCTMFATAVTDEVDATDTTPSNNVAPIEVNVVDETQASLSAPHESTLLSLAPRGLTIAAAQVGRSRSYKAKIRNADLPPVVEPGGHAVALQLHSLGDCPPASVNVPASPFVVPSGSIGRATFSVDVSRDSIYSPSRKSPQRCVATLEVVTGEPGNVEPVSSNNRSRLVLDVIDAGDF